MSTNLEHHFDTTGSVRLRVEVIVGDVTVTAGDAPTTTVHLEPHGRNGAELAEKYVVEARGGEIVVLAPKLRESLFSATRGSVDVTVEVPAGSTADLRTGAGDVRTTGRLGDVDATSGSGDVSVEEVAGARLKSGSGDLSVHSAVGDVRARTGSGEVTVGSAGGRLDLTSGSGDISVARSTGAVKAKTGSGDLSIGSSTGDLELVTGTGDVSLGAVQGGDVHARTGTGDVAIGVAAGVAALLDLNTVTGDVEIDLESADGPGDAEARTRLSVHSGSGDIRVARARLTHV